MFKAMFKKSFDHGIVALVGYLLSENSSNASYLTLVTFTLWGFFGSLIFPLLIVIHVHR
jgi:hypothetical protein